MVKMIVTSFYNTLIDKEGAIPTTTMLEIERIRKKGIIFSICTNRTYQELLEYNHDFPFVDYIISLNGSYIYEVNSEKCLFKSKISDINLKKINSTFEDYKKIYYTKDNMYYNFEDAKEQDIYKIEIELENDIDLKSIDKIKASKSIIEIDNKKYLELTSSKCNMFTGVDKISLKNNILLKEILVICSNDSDYQLVNNIPNNYVMKNGNSKLLKIAKKKTATNDKKGVEEILKGVK